jgi:hypothetical protein
MGERKRGPIIASIPRWRAVSDSRGLSSPGDPTSQPRSRRDLRRPSRAPRPARPGSAAHLIVAAAHTQSGGQRLTVHVDDRGLARTCRCFLRHLLEFEWFTGRVRQSGEGRNGSAVSHIELTYHRHRRRSRASARYPSSAAPCRRTQTRPTPLRLPSLKPS